MRTKKPNIRFRVISLMMLAAAFSRILPHPWNFTPLGAMALFGAAYYSNRILAFVMPLLALWLGDLVMYNTVYSSFHNHKLWLFPEVFPWYYLGFLLVVPLGFVLLKSVKLKSIIGASLSASVVFFLVSNFGCWLGSTIYPQSATGLFACYAVGIPFFWSTIGGDLFYCGVLFGAFELAKVKFPVLAFNPELNSGQVS
jgi:hypothetical protein